jgi:excinuclease ABC subunit A
VNHFGIDADLPFSDLPENFKQALYFGTGDQEIAMNFGANGKAEKAARPFEGLVPQMRRLYEETESELTRTASARSCRACRARRAKARG